MNRHRPYLELAAAAIDYPLETSERRHLDEHLAGCRECARAMAALGADAGAIGSLPPVRLAERRGDQILAAALRPAAPGHSLRLVAIAALLALLITGSIAVGAVLLQRMDEKLSVVLPLPSATASPDPEPSPVASPSASAGLVAVQPWGNFVVTSEDQQRSWVEVVMPDGSRTRLAEGAGAAWLGADRVVFECSQSRSDFLGICSINADASGPVQPITADANHPAPAPDGRSIAFHRAGIDLGETWIVRADGSGERRVAPGWLLEWSPDGAWLAGQPDGAAVQVAIIGADGTGLRRLAPGRDPAWSPAGDRLVYVFNDDQGVASLRTVDVATGEVTVQYTAAAGAELGEPAWLGDRGWVFVRDGDVWRLDVGASEPVRLTTDLAIPFGGLSGDPLAVSVDNQWVAFTTGIDADSRVGVVSANGDLDAMYPGIAGMSDPRWAPRPVVEAPTPASSPSAPAPTPSAPAASAKSPGGDLPVGWAWTASTVQAVAGRPDGLVEAVTAGGPGFVAVGRGCTSDADPACEGVVWTSTDGRAWARAAASDATDTGASFPTSGPELGMYDVAAGAPGIVAVGYAARPDMQATIWFSPDASSWERIPLGPDGPGTAPGDPMDIRIEAVTWDGQRFVAVGADRSDFNGRNLGTAQARAAVWTSTDGRSWARVPHTADLDVGGFLDTGEDPTTGGMRDVVAGPGGLVAVGANCDETAGGCWPAAWSSVDGTTWAQRPTDIPKIEAGDLREVAASDAAYIAVGPAWCDACQDLVFTSTDGRTWERQTFDGHSDFGAVASIGGMLFAIGPIGSTTVWTSDDGEVWLASGLDGGPTTGRGTAEWHIAATRNRAVWLGSTAASELPEAWVSEGQTAP